jgi:cullin 1
MLENIVRLFTYLINKDLFSEYYRKHLSKRLLLQRSASTDAEKSMIGKLKIRCGAQFTSKLEGMINDMRNAKDEQNNFSKFLQERRTAAGPLLPYEFTVQTLTTGFWPTQQSVDVKLPRELARGLTTFKLFYDSKTQNRKLQWLHPLGSVTLTRDFKSGRRDLIVSTVQAAILMYFNNTKVTSIEAMTKALNLDPPTIKAQLRSLVSGQFKVLLKKPAEGYNPKHLIRVNNNFAHQMRVIRIPNAVQKTTKKERDAAEGAVQEDRKHAIEANIVRVMKSRKTLTHQQLMSEVSQQLMQYFKPDPRQIKKRVEDLIQREYLERDKEKGGVYHYLA